MSFKCICGNDLDIGKVECEQCAQDSAWLSSSYEDLPDPVYGGV